MDAFTAMDSLCCDLLDILEEFGSEDVAYYRKEMGKIEKLYRKEQILKQDDGK